MPLDFRQFWNLAVHARLVTPERAKQLHAEFRSSTAAVGLDNADALPLARWLVAKGVLDRDQARMLLAGKLPTTPVDVSAEDLPPDVVADEPTARAPPENTPLIPRQPKRSRVPAFVAATAAVLVLAGIVGTVILWSRPASAPSPPSSLAVRELAENPRKPEQATAPADPSAQPAAETPRSATHQDATTTEIDDDGRTLWASPTEGKPLSLAGLPSGMQVLLVVRLAELTRLDEGRRLLDALGPATHEALAELERAVGLEPKEIDQLAIGFVADDAGRPLPALAVRSANPLELAELVQRWKNPAAAEHRGQSYYKSDRWAYYRPDSADGREFSVAPRELIHEIIERNGPPIMRRGLENLLRASDEMRHVTLLFSPAYLATDGNDLLAGDMERLREPLQQFFDVRSEAVMLSGHLADALFVEVRVANPVEVKPDQAAAELAKHLAQTAEVLERYVASFQAAPYSRLVLNRYPRMVQLLADYTRAGAEDRQAVLRAYLPLAAAHNLALGTQLLLAEQPSAEPSNATRPVQPNERPTTEPAAPLDRVVTLSFPRDTLEHSLELLGKEIDTEIVILGSDLQLEGITKNQSFGLDLRNRKVGDILREILRLANPEGKLVYVLRTSGPQETIYITTRAAAAKRGEKLPAELSDAEK